MSRGEVFSVDGCKFGTTGFEYVRKELPDTRLHPRC